MLDAQRWSPCPGRWLQKVRARPPPVPSPCPLPTQGPACRARGAGRAHPALSAPKKWEPRARPRERPLPTFQRFLQGLGEAGRSVALAVIPAGVLPRGEGRGRQVKVHEGQVMASHLDRRRHSNGAGPRCFSPGSHYRRLLRFHTQRGQPEARRATLAGGSGSGPCGNVLAPPSPAWHPLLLGLGSWPRWNARVFPAEPLQGRARLQQLLVNSLHPP